MSLNHIFPQTANGPLNLTKHEYGWGEERTNYTLTEHDRFPHNLYNLNLKECVIEQLQILPCISWGKEAINKIFEFMNLQQGWDTYDAEPVSEENICAAIQLLDTIIRDSTPKPDIFPTPSGGVQIEWANQELDLEIEVINQFEVSVLFEDSGGKVHVWGCSFLNEIDRLRNIISHFS
jgi:hypothetical protein